MLSDLSVGVGSSVQWYLHCCEVDGWGILAVRFGMGKCSLQALMALSFCVPCSYGLNHPSNRLIYYYVAKVVAQISYTPRRTYLRVWVTQPSRHWQAVIFYYQLSSKFLFKDGIISLLQHLTVAFIFSVISKIVQHVLCVLSLTLSICRLSDNNLPVFQSRYLPSSTSSSTSSPLLLSTIAVAGM